MLPRTVARSWFASPPKESSLSRRCAKRLLLTLSTFWGVLKETGHITAAVCFLVIAATMYTRSLGIAGVPVEIGNIVRTATDNFVVVLLIYILYLIGMIPMAGVVPIIIGFVLAVLNREDAAPLEKSHYEYLVRQGLMGLAFMVLSGVLMFVLIGFLGFIATAIWWIIRSVKGLLAINHHEPIANPKTWTW